MALYFVTYDLRNQRNYQKLYDALKEFNATRILESTWCFNRFDIKASNLRDHFMQFIDNDDGICVSEVTEWATAKTDGTPNDL